MSTIWKAIPGYEGLYEAGSNGEIRSLDRLTRGRHGARAVRGIVRKPVFNPRLGYWHVVLCKEGVRRTFTVHRLIALAFLGERPSGADVAHLNGLRNDNRPANLIFCNRAENLSHMVAHGTRLAGERHPGCKLSTADVIAIRGRCSSGESQSALAREYRVHPSHVSRLARHEHRVSVSETGGDHLY